ncbi:MAG: sugar transferase [Chloroflexaceae bacterium]|nr:sugar transferase [Chloroflexaceae bacterium]
MSNTIQNNQVKFGEIALPSYISSRDSVFSYACKRIMDVVAATLILFLLWPVMLFIALIVRLDSRGPSLFVQERVGARPRFENGTVRWEVQTFRFFKFRSMTHNADDTLHREHIKAFLAGTLDQADGGVKLVNDPRVTRAGAFLRKTSLDELPQLFNVIKGEMSLVGPRPVPIYEVEGYQPWHYERLHALPGITGIWQAKGRGESSFEEMIDMDIEYVRTRSLWLDIWLVLFTIPAVLSSRGAK